MWEHHYLRHEGVRGGSDQWSPAGPVQSGEGCGAEAVPPGKGTRTIPSDPAGRELANTQLPDHTPLLPPDP